jgi:hypothetical protein
VKWCQQKLRLQKEALIKDAGVLWELVDLEPSDYSLEERIAQLTEKNVPSPPTDGLPYLLPEPIRIESGLAQSLLQDDRNRP